MGIHIALYQPLIPANTGNISRTCAGTGISLHLIRPLGFSTDDKMLKRAGLDYWEHVDIHYHDSLDDLFQTYEEASFYFVTKFGNNYHTDMDYSDKEKDIFFVFGRETTGLPDEIVENHSDQCIRIPMNDNIRSLNLSNTAAVLAFEALRQQGYPGLK